MLENLNVLEILRLGFVGIAFLLAGLAYLLLRREQERAEPRAGMLRPIYVFMGFALVLAAASLYTQIRPPPGSSPSPRSLPPWRTPPPLPSAVSWPSSWT